MFFTSYNPDLSNMGVIVKGYLPFLHSDGNLNELFTAIAFNIAYKSDKNLKEWLSSPLYPNGKTNKSNSIIT